MLRFTAVGLRNPNILANNSNISSLGVLQDGCKVSPAATLSRANTFYALFDREVHGNGFYFVTSSTSPDLDPVKWYVQTSVNNGTSWTAIASSVMMINRDGSIAFSITIPRLISSMRNNMLKFDLRTTWEWIVCWIGADIFTFLQFFLVAVAGVMRKESYTKIIWVSMSFCGTILLAVSAIGYDGEGLLLDATYQWLNFLPSILFSFGVCLFEARYLVAVFIYGIARGGASAIQSVVLFQKPWILFATQDFALSTSPVALVFVLFVVLNRHRVEFQSWQLIVRDMKRYNLLWEDIKNGNIESLVTLKEEVQKMTKLCPKSTPRQLTCSEIFRESDSVKALPTFKVLFGYSRDYLLDSTDQLFVQAGCLHPLLLTKVRTWALLSDGSFPVMFARCPSYPKYAEIKDDDKAQIKYGKLKSAERSLEKLVRSYDMVSVLMLEFSRDG